MPENVRLKPEVEAELKRMFRRIREYDLLLLAVLIGILGSLIAGVINNLIKESTFYPWTYLLVLIGVLLILIFKFLKPRIDWKIFQYYMNKRIKEYKKVLNMVDAHRKKYPPRSRP